MYIEIERKNIDLSCLNVLDFEQARNFFGESDQLRFSYKLNWLLIFNRHYIH